MSSKVVQLHNIDLNSDRGHAFIVDATRAAEGVISDKDLETKYELSAADLRNIAQDPAVGKAIRAERESRLRSGRAARELAAKAFVRAPAVLDTIMSSSDSNNRHKIEAIKELRATAHGGGDDHSAAVGEKFTIVINLGGDVEKYETNITPKPPVDLERDNGDQWG
jgi:hypothetical protein